MPARRAGYRRLTSTRHSMLWAVAPWLFSTLVSLGCASLATSGREPFSLEEGGSGEAPPVEVIAASGTKAYTFNGRSLQVEWLACQPKGRADQAPKAAAVVVMHAERVGFDRKTFCNDGVAQAFASQGYTVIGVNRPGFGQSTGARDHAGVESLAALSAATAAARAATSQPTLVGAWGYETGVAAAGLWARQTSGLQFLLLGGGVYDYEATLAKTTDPQLKSQLLSLRQSGGDKAIEDRSLAYDVSGLPPRIMLYHGRADQGVPVAQAQAFADALAGNGHYKVSLQVVDNLGHEITSARHRNLIEFMLQNNSEGSAPPPG